MRRRLIPQLRRCLRELCTLRLGDRRELGQLRESRKLGQLRQLGDPRGAAPHAGVSGVSASRAKGGQTCHRRSSDHDLLELVHEYLPSVPGFRACAITRCK